MTCIRSVAYEHRMSHVLQCASVSVCAIAPVILRLEELEFLLDTVQRFQDCELEGLARLQGDLHRESKERGEKLKQKNVHMGIQCNVML